MLSEKGKPISFFKAQAAEFSRLQRVTEPEAVFDRFMAFQVLHIYNKKRPCLKVEREEGGETRGCLGAVNSTLNSNELEKKGKHAFNNAIRNPIPQN